MTRKNVEAYRTLEGEYRLSRGETFVMLMSETAWKLLGLKKLPRGATCIVDLQVSGVPEKKKVKL